jgi:hypothetical protein
MEGRGMAADDDLLRAEVDRQLAEVRAGCDGLATRAGILVAADSLAAAIVAPRVQADLHQSLLVLMLVAFGLSVVAGAVTLAPWLKVGPIATSLAGWLGAVATPTTSALLYDSKLAILMANLSRLLTMRIFFAIQALTTIIAVGLALSYAAWK